MSDNIDKRVVAILLVIAVVLSVVATWKVLTTQPRVTVIGPPQGTQLSLTVATQEVQKAPVVTQGAGLSLNVEETK